MLVWINLYFVFYVLLMLSLHYILNRISGGDFSKKSLIFAHFYILKYSKVKNIYLATLLALTGLPPFLIFFIKANYIISFVGALSIFSSIVIFVCYFINMLYYTQMYLYKNYIFDEMEYMDLRTETYDAGILYKIIVLLLITIFSIIFSPDIFFISTLFFS